MNLDYYLVKSVIHVYIFMTMQILFSAESGDRVGAYAYVFSHVIFCFSWSELPCFFISLFFYILMTRFFYALIDLTDPFSIFSVEAFLLWSSVLFHHTRPGCFPGNCITTILWLSLIILVSYSFLVYAIISTNIL